MPCQKFKTLRSGFASLDPKARALAGRLLGRFRCLVGNLPASADHHHSETGGLDAHSVEVALGTLEAFEGNIMMERKPDGSVDSFRVPVIVRAGSTPPSLLPCATTWESCSTLS